LILEGAESAERFGTKSKGRSRKPLAEVFSLERPVARHFV